MNKKLLVVAALLSSSMAFAREVESNEACAVSTQNVSTAQKNLDAARRVEYDAEAELVRVKKLGIKDKAKIKAATEAVTKAKKVTKDCLADLEKEQKMAHYDCQQN